MVIVSQLLATFCCALFAGAAVYITLVEHPARIECGTELAATEFGPSYRRAKVMQASLAVAGFLFAGLAWLGGASTWWLVGGVVLVSVAPFTLAVMMPTNRQLVDPGLDKRSARAAQLLSRWARLHLVRVLLSLAALVLFLSKLRAS